MLTEKLVFLGYILVLILAYSGNKIIIQWTQKTAYTYSIILQTFWGKQQNNVYHNVALDACIPYV